tara:strand:+ start:1413 stop:2192 length:780 start_codon:yes stop_codon:yes gene_type:complete
LDKKTHLKVRKLTVGYAQKPVLKEVSFDLFEGELICLLGANGKGKSTLLKTLMGILPSLGGGVFLKGKPLNELSADARAREMAIVLTDSLSDVNMKALEVVATGRYPYLSWNANLSEADHAIVKESLSILGAWQHANRWMHSLSDGERQRVLLARALAQQTDVVLLDEPTAFLDLAHTMELSVLLKKLSSEAGKSVLMSTHDWSTALQIADRIFWIDENATFHVLATKELKNGTALNTMLNTPFGTWNSDKGRFEIREV